MCFHSLLSLLSLLETIGLGSPDPTVLQAHVTGDSQCCEIKKLQKPFVFRVFSVF